MNCCRCLVMGQPGNIFPFLPGTANNTSILSPLSAGVASALRKRGLVYERFGVEQIQTLSARLPLRELTLIVCLEFKRVLRVPGPGYPDRQN